MQRPRFSRPSALLAAFVLALPLCLFLPLRLYAATILVDTTDPGVSDDGFCSLAEAIIVANTNTAANGCLAGDDSPMDTIVLAADAIYELTEAHETETICNPRLGECETYPTNGLPSITTTLTISGNGATIIRAAGEAFRLLNIGATGNLTLLNVTLRNGSSSEGGAIQDNGQLTLKESRITGNQGEWGAGIFISSSARETQIIDSEISNNQAQMAGGIANLSSFPLYIVNSRLTGNRADWIGGALSNSTWDNTTIMVSSTLAANVAERGGALHNGGTLVISDTDIVGNVAREFGGALFHEEWGVKGNELHISHSRLLDNRAAAGGAVYLRGSTGMIRESCIVGNSPIAVYHADGPRFEATANWWGTPDGPSVSGPGHGDSVSDYILFDDYQTGAILDCPSGTAVRKTFFPGVTLRPGGQVITVTTTTNFDVDNSDGNCTLAEAILAANTNLAHDQCPAGSSTHDIIVLAEEAIYSLVQSYGDYQGLTGLPSITSAMTIRGHGATIERTGSELFRLLHVAEPDGKLTLEDVTLRNGSEARGGGIYNRGTLTLDNVQVLSNTASLNGGGIFNGSTIAIDGRIASTGTVITLVGTHIAFNSAEKGGGIYNIELGEIYLNDTEIAFNHATTGGGIFALDSYATLTRVHLVANRAEQSGGGIANAGSLTMFDSIMMANQAANQGGGLHQFIREQPYPLISPQSHIYESQLFDNRAPDGSALRLEEGHARLHKNCIAGNNTVAIAGTSFFSVLATYNWWGAPDGPGGVGPGSGDGISEMILFEPFLTEPPTACPGVAAGD